MLGLVGHLQADFNKASLSCGVLTLNFLKDFLKAGSFLRYHCVLHEIFLSMAMISFQNEKMVVHKRFEKSRMNYFSFFFIHFYIHSKFILF